MAFEVKKFVEEKMEEIVQRVGKGKVLVATSGGVDSMACAALAHKVLGDRLKVVYIDDGLMRQRDWKTVSEMVEGWGGKAELIDVKEEFFSALRGMEDPEEKRKAFRDIFYKTLGRAIKESGANFLIQGTIAADVAETKRGVKTQHNVLEQIAIDPGKYGLEIIEPLRDIYKPQVREVAKAMGLPEKVCQRMPFPGPGLATRIIGEVTPERVEMVRKATSIVEEEIEPLQPFQCLAVLLKDKATGLAGEGRAYGDIMVVRSVESEDALTAEVTEVPWEILKRIRERIIKEVPSVVKVLYDITPKPPSTIEYI